MATAEQARTRGLEAIFRRDSMVATCNQLVYLGIKLGFGIFWGFIELASFLCTFLCFKLLCVESRKKVFLFQMFIKLKLYKNNIYLRAIFWNMIFYELFRKRGTLLRKIIILLF